MISVHHISKIYQSPQHIIKALDDVSLVIEPGEIVSLLGVNGAGKSTLSAIIATLHPPTSGDILIDGVSIYRDLKKYRNIIGFCPQQPNLDRYLNVRENLIFAGRYFGMTEQTALQRTDELIGQFSLEKYAEAPISSLSGGYKQRVSIARALIHHPRLVIFDEPTVGLDPHIRHQLWDIIGSLKKNGITVILTTHYLDEAEVLSDRVCMLSKGKIVLTKTVDELKKAHNKATLEEVFLEFLQESEA